MNMSNNEFYDNIAGAEHNIEINGFPFWVEEFSSNESYNRRELNRQDILGGTQFVTRGKYIPRQFSFTTHVKVPIERHDVHDKVFIEMMSKPAEIITPDFGGLFTAEVVVKKTPSAPDELEIEFEITEIPEEKSNIPNDDFKVPEDRLKKE